MGKGTIKAGRNIVAKFIENASATADGYIHAEAIIHSRIVSKGDVIVTGKKGFITGGSVQALGNVEAKIIGSTMGVDTEIQVHVITLSTKQKSTLQTSKKMITSWKDSKQKVLLLRRQTIILSMLRS